MDIVAAFLGRPNQQRQSTEGRQTRNLLLSDFQITASHAL